MLLVEIPSFFSPQCTYRSLLSSIPNMPRSLHSDKYPSPSTSILSHHSLQGLICLSSVPLHRTLLLLLFITTPLDFKSQRSFGLSFLIPASQMRHDSVGQSMSITLSEAPEPELYNARSRPRKLHLSISPWPRVVRWEGVTNFSSCCMTLTSITVTWKAQ